MRPRAVGFIIALTFTAFLPRISAEAQQPQKIHRVGFLSPRSSLPDTYKVLRQELLRLGYVEGQTIAFEIRFAGGKPDRLPDLAAELVRLKVDVIVVRGVTGIRAAKQATSTIPIVMAGIAVDPVAAGFVASLARPGGNITGLTTLAGELHGKRLELLKEVSPQISRVAILWPPGQRDQHMKEVETVGKALGIQIRSLAAGSLDQFETAWSAIIKDLPNALLVSSGPAIPPNQARIIDFATKRRLLTIFDQSRFVDAGGLMCYGVDLWDLSRRAAYYVDRILKGTKPADLPVEQPTKFELIINLKAAKQIGLTIPPNLLARADKVIK